jgi:hypothetical protein
VDVLRYSGIDDAGVIINHQYFCLTARRAARGDRLGSVCRVHGRMVTSFLPMIVFDRVMITKLYKFGQPTMVLNDFHPTSK